MGENIALLTALDKRRFKAFLNGRPYQGLVYPLKIACRGFKTRGGSETFPMLDQRERGAAVGGENRRFAQGVRVRAPQAQRGERSSPADWGSKSAVGAFYPRLRGSGVTSFFVLPFYFFAASYPQFKKS